MNCFRLSAPTDIETQKFERRAAQAMSLWCLWWLAVYATNYVQLTWRLISDLHGVPWILMISPCFWIWVAVFSFSTFVAERLIRMSWHDFEKKLNLAKVAGAIVLLPFALWLLLTHICPYLYPAVCGTLRLVPIIGGRGF